MGSRVRERRLARGFTQEQLAERAGLSYKFVGEVERGLGNPTLVTLASLADALGIDPGDLVRITTDAEVGTVSPADYATVRDALDSIETIFKRVGAKARTRRR